MGSRLLGTNFSFRPFDENNFLVGFLRNSGTPSSLDQWCVHGTLPKTIPAVIHIIRIWTGYEGNSTKYMPESVRVDNYFTRP